MYNSFPVCRTIFDHWIYSDSEYLKVWITMLGRARYLKEPKQGVYEKVLYTINYGEFIFGLKSWSENTGISYQRLRSLIKKLTDSDMIKLKQQTSKFSIYEIVNYEKFNSQQNTENTELQDTNNSQSTVSQQSVNSQSTTNKESKEGKKDKNIFSSDSDEYRLADYLRKYMIKNNPKARIPDDNKIQGWCKTIDLMMRIEKRTVEEIKTIIQFSQTDSFWKSNVLSANSLRDKFDQLTVKMQEKKVVKLNPYQSQQVTPKCKMV